MERNHQDGHRIEQQFKNERNIERKAVFVAGKMHKKSNPEIRQTLDLRHPYTDPLHLLQIELIKRCREESGDLAQAHKALLVTIAGIAASMRNTG